MPSLSGLFLLIWEADSNLMSNLTYALSYLASHMSVCCVN
jgi:hypothetical protein